MPKRPIVFSPRTLFAILLLLLITLCVGTGCGGFDDDMSGVSGAAALPSGDPSSPAISALADVSADPVDGEDVDGDVLLTRLMVTLKPDATLGELQSAIQSVGATGVSFSRNGSLFLDLEVPRQPDFARLHELALRLREQPGILFAEAGQQFQVLELPPANAPPVDTFDLFHTLVTRFPAAWNVRRLVENPARKVSVVAVDSFSGPRVKFDQQLENAASTPEFVPFGRSRHGYQVVGTLAARFDALQSHGANPVPRSLSINLVQMAGLTKSQALDKMFGQLEDARRASGPIIVNFSLGYNYNTEAELHGNNPDDVRSRIFSAYLAGLHWAHLTRDPAFADEVMLVVAAGNDRGKSLVREYPGLQNARLSTPFATAAVADRIEELATDPTLWNPPAGSLGDLRLGEQDLANLLLARNTLLAGRSVTGRNLVLVGSVDGTQRIENVVESSFSNNGSQLFAVGAGVHTITESDADGDGFVDGTSFSTPQVAGLASYLWSLDDSLRALPVESTLKLLKATSRSNSQVSDLIDAYGAVLALDARRGDLRMRRELLDVSGPQGVPDFKFNEFDLQKFEQVYGLANPGGPTDPNLRDYSRHDLNGDGFTGGTKVDQFDLDADGLTQEGAPIFNSVQVDVEGSSVTLDERAVTDLDILKYYAYVNGPDNRPLVYDTSNPNALSERARIFGPDGPPIEVTIIANGNTSLEHITASCDENRGTLFLNILSQSQPSPLSLSAGPTTVAISQPSPNEVTVHLTTSLPPPLVCGIENRRSSTSGNVFLQIRSPGSRGTYRIVKQTSPDEAPTVQDSSTSPFPPFGFFHEERISFSLRSKSTPQTISNFEVFKLTFTPDP